MKRLLIAFLATLVLACGRVAPIVEPTGVEYLEAIRPIQVRTDELNEMVVEKLQALHWQLNPQGFSNICTAGHVGNHTWITAAHCLMNIGDEGRFVEGQAVHPIYINVSRDVALFSVPDLTIEGILTFSDAAVSINTKLIVAGHPFGYNPIFVTRGFVANSYAFIEDKHYMIFNVAGAPGNSGSPVLNEFGEIVSILQIGWGSTSFSPVTGGATQETMKELRKWLAFREHLQ